MPQFYDSRELEHSQYKVVLASCSTTQVSSSTDAAASGDYLHQLIVVPASSGAGVVTVFDGGTAVLSIPAVAGSGTGTVCPPPYTLKCGMVSVTTQGWNITCGANIHAIAVGRFNR